MEGKNGKRGRSRKTGRKNSTSQSGLLLFSLSLSLSGAALWGLKMTKTRTCDVHALYPISGRWSSESRQDDFFSTPCCGWDAGAIPDTRCQTRARIPDILYPDVSVVSASVSGGSIAFVGGNGCSCPNVRPVSWKPAGCQLPDFDPDHFCALLRDNGKLLFVGDSTMHQFYASVNNAVWTRCPEHIGFGHSDTLLGARNFGVLNRGKHWKEYLAEFNPTFLVMSTGAHYTNTSDFVKVLKELKKDVSELPAGVHTFWRTQNPAGCVETDDIAKFNSLLDEDSIRYGHDKTIERDAITADIFQGSPIKYIDVRPLYLAGIDARPNHANGKLDCQHFCINSHGPMGLLPRLMQNAIAQVVPQD